MLNKFETQHKWVKPVWMIVDVSFGLWECWGWDLQVHFFVAPVLSAAGCSAA